ncbi:MAG: hypothetical protein C0425_00845 [Chlorobiaceae bacterium]|nr:hypothetical protein [Chlorobiaceae bacterium]MBA4308869.1 hypothetical protein [Chlorobiaceae bacterium]
MKRILFFPLIFFASFINLIAQPNLHSPLNNATNISIPVTFIWGSVPGSTGYTLQISTDGGFTSPVNIINTGGNDTTEIVDTPTLTYNQAYFWRVVNNGGDTSNIRNFFPLIVPSAPTLILPADNNTNVRSSPYFSWVGGTTVPNDTFQLQLTPDPSFYSVEHNIFTTNSHHQLTAELPTGSPYFWRVRGINNAGAGSFSAVNRFRVSISGDSLPPRPIISFPSDSIRIYTLNPDLNWYINFTLGGYLFQIEKRSDPMFTGIPTDTTSSLVLPWLNLNPNTFYYYKVRTKRLADSSLSEWSGPGIFQTFELSPVSIPINAYPTNGVTVYQTNVNFSWYINAPSFGLTYELQYDTTTSFAGFAAITGLTSTSHQVMLGANKTYYWRTRTYNGTTTSAWSTIDTFFIADLSPLNNIALLPVKSYPIQGEVVYSDSVDLYWYLNGPFANLSFQVEFNSTNIFSGVPTYNNITTMGLFDQLVLNFGTTYYWRVRSFNINTNQFSAWTDVDSFSVVGAGGNSIPNLAWPIGGATVWNTSVDLSWWVNGPSHFLDYEIEFNSTNIFSGIPTFSSAGNIYSLTNLIQGATYYWRVRSVIVPLGTPPVYSVWSPVESFTIFTTYSPSSPRIGGPGGGIVVNTTTPMLSWFLATASPFQTYEISYSQNPDMSNSQTITDLRSLNHRLIGLNPNQNYYWRVRSKNLNNVLSQFSNITSFRVGNLTDIKVEENIPTEFSLSQNFPNPFNPITVINYKLPMKSQVSLKVYDILGRVVASLIDEEQLAGVYNIEFNSIGLSSGIYFYKLVASQTSDSRVNNFTETRKMILMR